MGRYTNEATPAAAGLHLLIFCRAGRVAGKARLYGRVGVVANDKLQPLSLM